MTQRHKWADVIIAWANGEEVQIKRGPKEWIDYGNSPISPMFSPAVTYRIKPRTIKIGDIEVPEPLSTPLEAKSLYYVADPASPILYGECLWGDDLEDTHFLESGMAHIDMESAIAHAKALIKISGGTI